MSRRSRIRLPRWTHFVIPVVLAGLVVGLRYTLTPILGDTGPFFLASLAVLISAFIGGLWPGLLATLITTVAGVTLFMEPSAGSILSDVKLRIVMGAQITVCCCISLICGALRSSEIESERSIKQERDARDKLDALFNSITDKVLVVARDFKLIRFNSAAAARWGIKSEDVGLGLDKILPQDIEEALRIPLQRTLELNEPISIEVRDRKFGQAYEVRTFPNPDGLLIYFHNITQRIQTNDAITSLMEDQERANALLDSLLTHAPLGFGFFDRDHRYQRINNHLAEIHGVSIPDHIGKSVSDILLVNAPVVKSVIDQVFQTGEAIDQFEITGATLKEPGVPRHWHTGFYPVKDSHGQVASVGAIVIDITHRKQIEDRLRQSEFRFRNLTDNSPMMIWVCNPDGSANWFNKPWLDFRGLSLDAAIEEGCFANIHAEDEPWAKEMQKAAFAAGEPFALEFRVPDADNEYRWIHLKANPVQDSDGRVINYLMSSLDVTDRINMEENLRKSLANERAARSDAEKANRLKDEFLAGLSHELRTPLTTMLGWTELLMKPKIREAELMDGLEVIQKSSKLQLQLINDLLDMSRISIGKINLEFEYADLLDAVQSVVDMVQNSAADKGIPITLIEPEEPIIVRIDPDRFTQIIWNLLSNAIKFTPSSGNVTVEVGRESGDAFVKVVDSGIGIEPSFLEHVFDRFRQADASLSRRHGGLGLGLAIAKQLSELHGGNIDVDSKGTNMGCTFTVTIPLAEAPFAPHRQKVRPIASESEDARRLVDVCILLVEDDSSSRDVLKRILELEGAMVVGADSASIARRLLKETNPDVLVSDIGLPDEDGYQLMRSIRSSGTNEASAIPALALTAFAGSEDRLKAFEAGFNLYLTKPVEPDDLVRAVLEVRTSDL